MPLSRFSLAEIRREVLRQGLVAEISGATLWRWLHADALRPWHHRSWIFPRDPDCADKAARVLDLYQGRWKPAALLLGSTCCLDHGQLLDSSRQAVERFRSQWPSAVLVHTRVHASWLNQIEIDFSILQRKALTPNDFCSLAELDDRLIGFQRHYERIATPFQWTFTSQDLKARLAELDGSPLTRAAWLIPCKNTSP